MYPLTHYEHTLLIYGFLVHKVLRIKWTLYSLTAFLQDVRVDLGRTNITMTEQFLDGAQIISGLEQMGSKRMPEGVTTAMLRAICTFHCRFHRSL